MVASILKELQQANYPGKLKKLYREIVLQNDDFDYYSNFYENLISARDVLFTSASIIGCLAMAIFDDLFKKTLPQSVIDGYVGAFRYIRQDSDPMEAFLGVFMTIYMFFDEAFDIMDFDGFERRFKTNYEECKLWNDKFAEQLKVHFAFLYETEIVMEDAYSNYLYYGYTRVIMATYEDSMRLHSRISGGITGEALWGTFDTDDVDFWFLPERLREKLSKKTFEESWHKPIHDRYLEHSHGFENFKTVEEMVALADIPVKNYKSFMQQTWEKRWLQVFLGFETKYSPNRRESIIRGMGHTDYFEDFIEMCDCMDLRYLSQMSAEEYEYRNLWEMCTPFESEDSKFDLTHALGVRDNNVIDRYYYKMLKNYARNFCKEPEWEWGTPGLHNGKRWDAGIYRDIEMTEAQEFVPNYHHSFYTYVYDEALDCGLFQFDENIDESSQITKSEIRDEAFEAIYRNIEELDLFANSFRMDDFDTVYRRSMTAYNSGARAIIGTEKMIASHYEHIKYLFMTNKNLTTSISNNDYIFDSATPYQLGFQDPATPIMEGIIDLHHDLAFFMVLVSVFVTWMLSRIVYFFRIKDNKIHVPARFTHHTTLEVVWTIVPSLILILIAVPSFALLYAMDEVINPSITLKTVGHQWYWSYEYSDQGVLAKDQILFDSYMMLEEDLSLGYLRLLEVDNRVVLPSKVHVRLLITAADVLHSWAVPSLGVKLDACPGRLNQTAMYIKRNGTFYGQCSEICGVNHAFMPITVDAVDMDDYIQWVSSKLEEN